MLKALFSYPGFLRRHALCLLGSDSSQTPPHRRCFNPPYQQHHGSYGEAHKPGADSRVYSWYVLHPKHTSTSKHNPLQSNSLQSAPHRVSGRNANPREDRLYIAAYTQPPTAETLFPYTDSPATTRSPSKRGLLQRKQPFYFSVDDSLLYNAFHHDFGPLHIGHLYRFALYFHDVLAAPENKDRPIVFWSAADPRSMWLSSSLAVELIQANRLESQAEQTPQP